MSWGNIGINRAGPINEVLKPTSKHNIVKGITAYCFKLQMYTVYIYKSKPSSHFTLDHIS